jgi:hypothetical protein
LLDETLVKETDVLGVDPDDLGSFSIEIYKYKNLKWRVIPEDNFQAHLTEYHANLAAQASKIDEKSFSKDGITHKLGLVSSIQLYLSVLTDNLKT